MQMQTLRESVGKKGANKAIDVLKAQNLINNNNLYTGLAAPLPMTGVVDDTMIGAIESFQRSHPLILSKAPDGLINANGRTLVQLKGCKNQEGVCKSYFPIGFDGNFFVRFNTETFFELYGLQYPKPGITADATLGLDSLLNAIIADTEITNIAWAAYMLATVKHECANTWRPIEEYGKAVDTQGNLISADEYSETTGFLDDGCAVCRPPHGGAHRQSTCRRSLRKRHPHHRRGRRHRRSSRRDRRRIHRPALHPVSR